MRVIAGRLGGRRLVAPRGHATRPTSDRVREALFSMLGDVSGASVLDLYAGTGALGIEALSRGAARAVFVESAPAALAALRENLRALDLAGVSRVVAAPVDRAVLRLREEGPFELVLVDPPYAHVSGAASRRGAARTVADKQVKPLLGRLVVDGVISPGARLVLEHAARDEPPVVDGLNTEATRVYGDTALTFYACGPP
jgi:16S rRNA (guanine966-N2)-methyltransferase